MATLIEASASGDRMATLVALRESIATAIDARPSGRDIAALSKRLMEVMDEIDALRPDDAPKTDFDRLRERAGRR